MRLEAKGSADYTAQLDAKLKLKQKEVEAHAANKPAMVEQPNNLTPEQRTVYAGVAGELDKERATLSGLETKIAEHQGRQKTLTEHIAVAKKLDGRLKMNKGRLTSLVRLSYLGPEIVRALLAGSQANALTPSRLLRLSKNLPHDWKEQRCFLGFAA